MAKKILCLFIVFITATAFSQIEIENENLYFKVVKARKIGALTIQFGNSYNINSGKDDKRVQIRLKIGSLNGEKTAFDPNKLSYISDAHKMRFSISEIQYATFFREGFPMLTSNNSEDDNPVFAKYKPEFENTFFNFPHLDYKDICVNLNFGTNKKPKIHTIYFQPTEVDKNTLDVFFILPNGFKTGKILYSNILLSEINFR